MLKRKNILNEKVLSKSISRRDMVRTAFHNFDTFLSIADELNTIKMKELNLLNIQIMQ